MFSNLFSLTKAVIGVVVETPVAIVADVITMGGAMTDKDKPYTAEALGKVMKNVKDTTK
ncbi:hypothetical protein [Pseudomonas sp.]|uniref:hypothetical protein n=1 Tax=Pseudomonas sp. TaxID=306 RepID=UPI003FD77FFF